MSLAEGDELAEVLGRIKTWSPSRRLTLARHILETLETTQAPAHRPTARSVRELIGIGSGDAPPPDDPTIRRWIEEHRMEKYG